MQGPAWVHLFRRIPTELYETIALVLTTGAEVVVHSVVRLERDFAVVRGRMAGSLDAARVVIVPYDQVNYLAFNKKLTDVEVEAIFAKPQAAAELAEAQPLVEEVSEEYFLPEKPAPVPAQPTAAAPTSDSALPAKEAGATTRPGQVSKSVLLARLRARLAKEGPGAKPGEH